jgi:DNA-binding response OmpR family regulator
MKQALANSCVLIVDDEPLIAIDLAAAFEEAGAVVITSFTLHDALIKAQNDGLDAAIVDYAIGAGNSTELCNELNKRGVPLLVYSGLPSHNNSDETRFVSKPASSELLVGIVDDLISARKAGSGT